MPNIIHPQDMIKMETMEQTLGPKRSNKTPRLIGAIEPKNEATTNIICTKPVDNPAPPFSGVDINSDVEILDQP
jgi:hypothetical protein